MPRLPRLSLAKIPQHIVQRGNNRLPSFFSSNDYQLYLEFLEEAAEKYEVMLHAYCLMPNHVHLLMTPETKNGISRVLQDLGRRYVRHINYRYGRTGTLWEGRYHSCLVEGEKYIIKCYQYIESNPVRSRIVQVPQDYKWSSYHYNALADVDSKLTPHAEYLKLGKTRYRRCYAYKKIFASGLDNEVIHQIRESTQSNRVFGSEQFIDAVEAELSISIHKKRPGRPQKDYGYSSRI